MFHTFQKYLSGRATLTSKELELVLSLSTEKKIAKRAFILREGEICCTQTFITNGLLRLFRTDDKGNEYTLRFAAENRWISDRESYVTGKPSNFNIEAIEDSGILVWKKEAFDFLLKELPVFKALMKSLSTKSQIANENRIYASISNSAEEKYLQFIEKQPGIFNRVPLHMVASYLGVTRETLSRIRKQLAHK